ncbi:MAG TPA: ABC transporter ATP-binding protein [Candidatus Limnocylindria bacterium]
MPTTAALSAQGVRKRFHDIDALAGLDLTVAAGEIVGLLGPNGSGKTTFIRAVAGLVRPDGGTIEVLGRQTRDAVAAGVVGYMTQTAALYQELTVEENLSFFAALRGLRDPKAAISEALGVVDITSRRRSIVATLSGGMRQRVSLAIALLGRPPLLLLDEPTVGVDPAQRREFWSYFRTLTRAGTAMLVSSHVMDEAERCDRLALIRSGRVIAQGSAAEIRGRAGTADLEEAFLKLSDEPT